jgi:hypothetical protein
MDTVAKQKEKKVSKMPAAADGATTPPEKEKRTQTAEVKATAALMEARTQSQLALQKAHIEAEKVRREEEREDRRRQEEREERRYREDQEERRRDRDEQREREAQRHSEFLAMFAAFAPKPKEKKGK